MLGALLSAGCAAAQPAEDPAAPVRYTVGLPAPQTQMVEMTIEVADVHGESIDLALPTWRPGRYLILDPAGTVRQVRASDAGGRVLPVGKLDKSTWRVTTNGASSIRVDYRIYANSLADRTRHVDDTHAFLSGSSVFMYVPDRRGRAVHVRVDAPADWSIATGLEPAPGDARSVIAPNYDVLVDSPLEIGLHDRIDFEVDGVPHEIVIWPRGIEHDASRLSEDFAAVVREQASIFGRMPYRRFVFLIHAAAGAGGGTEHLNSTIMQTSRAAIEGTLDNSAAYRRFLGLVSHEMFHTWNVKQLRPSGIHPYDYQQENYSKLFWVAEGTTSYYDDLTLARAGLMKPNRYMKVIGDAIGALRNRPGAAVQSLEESSFDAWIKFNRQSPDDVNSEISFYSKGALVSLLLDLHVRQATGNSASLDDVMRSLFERFPLSGPGFTPDDLLAAVETVSGAEFETFFARYVRGTDDLPLEDALPVVGLELHFKPVKKPADDADDDEADDADDEDGDVEQADEPEHEPVAEAGADVQPVAPPLKGYLGLDLDGARVRSVRSDGPAYAAGIQPGDELIALDGRRVSSSNLDARLKRLESGDQVSIHLMRRDELREVRLTLASRPDGAWTVRRVKEPTDAQKDAYESWIGQAWPE